MILDATRATVDSRNVYHHGAAGLVSNRTSTHDTRGHVFLKPAAAKHIFRTGNVFSSGGAWPKRNVAKRRRSTIHVVRLPSELDELALVLGLDPKRVAAGLVRKKLSSSRLCSSSRWKIHWTQLRFYESGHGHARTRSLVVDNGVRARVASTFKLSVQVVWNQWI